NRLFSGKNRSPDEFCKRLIGVEEYSWSYGKYEFEPNKISVLTTVMASVTIGLKLLGDRPADRIFTEPFYFGGEKPRKPGVFKTGEIVKDTFGSSWKVVKEVKRWHGCKIHFRIGKLHRTIIVQDNYQETIAKINSSD
ncbi:MAG: hypothetical protein OXC63_08050, partial [Aestuariivita sp.]|nr:hypothetical protein [Aestuariivita sp.]